MGLQTRCTWGWSTYIHRYTDKQQTFQMRILSLIVRAIPKSKLKGNKEWPLLLLFLKPLTNHLSKTHTSWIVLFTQHGLSERSNNQKSQKGQKPKRRKATAFKPTVSRGTTNTTKPSLLVITSSSSCVFRVQSWRGVIVMDFAKKNCDETCLQICQCTLARRASREKNNTFWRKIKFIANIYEKCR